MRPEKNFKCIDCTNQAETNELYCWDCDKKFNKKMEELRSIPIRPTGKKRG